MFQISRLPPLQRSFEVILNFYRTGAIIAPPWLPLELLVEEARFFAIDLAGLDNGRADNRRLSMELMNMEYKNRIADAAVYKKMSRHKLLSDYHAIIVEVSHHCIVKFDWGQGELGLVFLRIKSLPPLLPPFPYFVFFSIAKYYITLFNIVLE